MSGPVYAGDLGDSLTISAAAMEAQAKRLRIISENIANADSVGQYPGAEPYRRKLIFFKNKVDRKTGVPMVTVDRYGEDDSQFPMKYDPMHPAANDDGYVMLPNVKTMIEMADMREAQRSYEANVNIIDMSKTLMAKTIDIIQ